MRARILALAGILCAAAAAADQTITVGPGISFSPSTVSISPGETVTWTWAAASLPHSTTSDATTGPEVWDSGVQTAGSFAHTFNTPGDYAFHCQVHSFAGGTAMNGVVQVVATATPTATATATTRLRRPSRRRRAPGTRFRRSRRRAASPWPRGSRSRRCCGSRSRARGSAATCRDDRIVRWLRLPA